MCPPHTASALREVSVSLPGAVLQALAGSREVLGDGHPDTLKCAGNLAACLVDVSKYIQDEAAHLQEASLKLGGAFL